MRPNPYGAQLELPDGTVIGKAAAVTGAEIPSVRYLTPQEAQDQLDALAKAEAERKAKLKAQAEARAKAKAEKEAAAKAKAKAKAEAEAKAKAKAGRKGAQP
jgi:membrane protein involved in colicin uptake